MKIAHLCGTALLLVAILTACNQSARERIAGEFNETLRQYCSDDAAVAEKALLRHRETLHHWKEDEVKLDYDQALAVVNARLFAMQRSLGNEEQARQFFRSCTNYLNQGRVNRNHAAKIYSENEVLAIVEHADKDLEVRWKTRKTGSIATDSPTNVHQ